MACVSMTCLGCYVAMFDQAYRTKDLGWRKVWHQALCRRCPPGMCCNLRMQILRGLSGSWFLGDGLWFSSAVAEFPLSLWYGFCSAMTTCFQDFAQETVFSVRNNTLLAQIKPTSIREIGESKHIVVSCFSQICVVKHWNFLFFCTDLEVTLFLLENFWHFGLQHPQIVTKILFGKCVAGWWSLETSWRSI